MYRRDGERKPQGDGLDGCFICMVIALKSIPNNHDPIPIYPHEAARDLNPLS
uniref:Uncharacterized protein n=1 Tax=Aliivibrio fischeri TaxID=668 RepID=H2ES15_ALIFS|nr:hypothetical protein [Aliivibrio fischeri]